MTCPHCHNQHTVLTGSEEGWKACGPCGTHVIRRHHECKACGHEWTEDVEEGWEVLQTMPDMDHTASVRHACGTQQTVDVEQYRGQRAVTCGCGFAGTVDFAG